ncbi:mannonate dehydratase [Devosia yakushimensis]|uniref:Mannonate dehydratase n=1 Tax=Devosia yakushimensis TaxID=470028 RepID=A0ABQ5UGH3_9HYPH|nr:mannonate dehydratase [Devosia yakushimensis]GLQ10581.1 mannonate dehydratase [Devosia yakushimensis]
MIETWRWFGPTDVTTISDIMQTGAGAIVSALHHVPDGAVWSPHEITKRQVQIGTTTDGRASGLAWLVVESLPVSEDIKQQTGKWREHIANYKLSLENLAAAGIFTVCYNFMPVIDWTRTDLAWRLGHGGTCMRFDAIDFAAFDIHLLQRKGAAESVTPFVADAATARFVGMSGTDKGQLAASVLAGLPGAADRLSIDTVREHLSRYGSISGERLRRHLFDFLEEVVPVAARLGIRLCCHPDDPPFPLMGLPRIMSTEVDYRAMLEHLPDAANGMTLCSGALGARPDNDLPGIMRRLGDRVHFLHLRNVRLEGEAVGCSFHESEHLDGSVDMVELIRAIVAEEARRKAVGRSDWVIPMRPDHGQDILDDLRRGGQPGYPLIGRLKGLAELRGVARAFAQVGQ